MTIHLEIPLTEYMPLAGAAALHGMDVATYAKTRSQALATRVADHAAATLAAASAEQPLGALPSHSQAAPEPAAPTETQPEDPAVEEEMLAYFDR